MRDSLKNLALRWIVWAMFWIVFQLGSLIGFIFLGIAAFKLTPDEMNAEAGKFQILPPHFPHFFFLQINIYLVQRVFYQHSITFSLCCPRYPRVL